MVFTVVSASLSRSQIHRGIGGEHHEASCLHTHLMLALAVAPAFAAKNSQIVQSVQRPSRWGPTIFAAGNCKVSWNGTGDAVQVTLAANGKCFTIPAKLVEEKNSHKGYIVSREGGADQLQTIQLNNLSLQLAGADRFRPAKFTQVGRNRQSLTHHQEFCSFTHVTELSFPFRTRPEGELFCQGSGLPE